MQEVISLEIYSFIFIFFRLGSAIVFMPVFRTGYISERVRLCIGLSISLVLVPFLQKDIIVPPNTFSEFMQYSFFEITYGAFLGLFMQILFYAINFFGSLASTATGFANAQFFNPSTQTQSLVIEAFVSILALTLVLILDIHHTMISAVIDSYKVFPFGSPLPLEDMSFFFSQMIADSFVVGFKLASPFIAFILIFYSCMGMFSRLMPQLNIFFLSIPLQIYFGLALLFITIPVIIMWFLEHFETGLLKFVQ